MRPTHRLPTVLGLLLLTGCASAPEGPKEDIVTPEELAIAEERRAAAEDFQWRQQLPRLMLDLQTGLSRYWDLVYASGPPRNDENREKLARFLRETVERKRPNGDRFRTNFQLLQFVAADGTTPRNQAIALGALGFCDREAHEDVLNTLVNGVLSEDEDVSHHAVLGLAVLDDKRTPPGVLARVIRDETRRPEDRSTAAWALYQLQLQTVEDRLEPIVAIWLDVLEGPLDEEPEEVTVTAVRGLGQTRDAAYRETIERYVEHPTALVRMASAIALGRIREDASAPVLLSLLGPAESNQNVRLAARKALQELAPGVDRGYDLEEWRKVFDRRE